MYASTFLCPSTTPSGLQSVSFTLSAREPLAVTSVRPLNITVTGPPLADDPEMLLGLIFLMQEMLKSTVQTKRKQSGFWDSAMAVIFLPPQLVERKLDSKP